jgi:hypothetical protein
VPGAIESSWGGAGAGAGAGVGAGTGAGTGFRVTVNQGPFTGRRVSHE